MFTIKQQEKKLEQASKVLHEVQQAGRNSAVGGKNQKPTFTEALSELNRIHKSELELARLRGYEKAVMDIERNKRASGLERLNQK